MTKIKPHGSQLIVEPLKSEDTQTEAGIFVLDINLAKAKVIEVSDEWSDRFKVGDIVIFPEGSGLALPHYNKKKCLWIDGRSIDLGGSVYGIIIE